MKNTAANARNDLNLRNRQRARPIDIRLFRGLTWWLLSELMGTRHFVIDVCFVPAAEMARLNEAYLGHTGSTDVITFDYGSAPRERRLHGEIVLSVEDALRQARQFRTAWTTEIVRYLIHGLLHLQGHDDLEPAARRVMRREENRLLKEVTRSFPLRELARRANVRPRKSAVPTATPVL